MRIEITAASVFGIACYILCIAILFGLACLAYWLIATA